MTKTEYMKHIGLEKHHMAVQGIYAIVTIQ